MTFKPRVLPIPGVRTFAGVVSARAYIRNRPESLDNKSDIRQVRPGTVSLPQRFKEAGYWTGAVGKVFHNEKIDPGKVAWHQMLRFEKR